MATSTDCYPWFHGVFQPLRDAPQVIVHSGCGLDGNGDVVCDPESMRADAEAQLQASGVLKSLNLETYTLARNMFSEIGDGTIEEMVSVGEAAVNRAKLRGYPSVNELLLYLQPSQRYGEIQSGGTGRWASTSRDPSVLAVLLADLVLRGESGNFNNGADDQSAIGNSSAYPNPEATLHYWANSGNYWVGPLPGVDPMETFQLRHYGVSPNDPDGAALLQRGLDAVAQGHVSWPADLRVCSRPLSKLAIGAGLAGVALGAYAYHRHLVDRLLRKVPI